MILTNKEYLMGLRMKLRYKAIYSNGKNSMFSVDFEIGTDDLETITSPSHLNIISIKNFLYLLDHFNKFYNNHFERHMDYNIVDRSIEELYPYNAKYDLII